MKMTDLNKFSSSMTQTTKLLKEDNPNSYNLTRINNPILNQVLCSFDSFVVCPRVLQDDRFGPRVKWAIKGDNER